MITIEVDGTESFVESSHTALFGSICRSGSGRGVVILIGADTAIGEVL
jgi:magnesium-transporting ATPase (P-type)